MILKNHIAYKLLTDENFVTRVASSLFPQYHEGSGIAPNKDDIEKISLFVVLLRAEGQKAYLVTQTVLDNLDLLKITRKPNTTYDWTVFRDLPDQKMTFIMPNGGVIRVLISNSIMMFGLVGSKGLFLPFHLNRFTGEVSGSFVMKEVKEAETFIYRLLCFIFLTENDEVEMKPGEKKGTQKQGKIINSLPFPLTIINSRWNTKVTVSGAFPVRGHFSIRWTGVGREVARLVFIEPFEKKGYVRNAGSESVK